MNKENLLPDNVAGLLGLTMNNPQVKDALIALQSNMESRIVWGQTTVEIPRNSLILKDINLGFKPKLVIVYKFSPGYQDRIAISGGSDTRHDEAPRIITEIETPDGSKTHGVGFVIACSGGYESLNVAICYVALR